MNEPQAVQFTRRGGGDERGYTGAEPGLAGKTDRAAASAVLQQFQDTFLSVRGAGMGDDDIAGQSNPDHIRNRPVQCEVG